MGGLLELFGLALVAWDVIDASRLVGQMTPAKVKELPGRKMPNPHTQAQATATVVAGNVRRRKAGVLLFALGVIVQTAGNIIAIN